MLRGMPLGEEHDVDAFDCGQPDLDGWLRHHARSAEAKRIARTYVLLDEDGRIAAYYALAAHKVARTTLPPRLGRGDPAEVPAVLIAKLAVRSDLQGKGLGAEVLGDACRRIVAASRVVGARYVVVDAIDDFAAEFYEHHGFVQVPGIDRRLVLKVSDVARAVGVAP